jgi:ACS family hexuronate transporter-like MFS transporter
MHVADLQGLLRMSFHHTFDQVGESHVPVKRPGRQRWVICALLFFAGTVNYMDRQVIGLLKPTLQVQFGWTEIGYSNIVLAFQFAYGAGVLFVGKLIDRLGTRIGFSLSVLFWSCAAMAHAAAGTLFQFEAARFCLGVGESGSFPASIKAVAEWFPKRERALATGIFNSGTNVGAIVTPLIVPLITYRYGWRMAFIATGALGLIWIAAWLILYRSPARSARISAQELALIHSDPDGNEDRRKVPLRRLIRLRQSWALALAKLFTDPIWYVYLFWMPDFLSRNLKMDLRSMALPLFIIYSGASIGSVSGGWLSSFLLRKGWSLNASRKTALLACALSVTPIMISARTSNAWLAVFLVAIAAGAHQGWSANLYTLASDMFPKSAVASVVGFATMLGAIGGMFISKLVGYILQSTGSYVPIFIMAGSAYLIALAFIQLLAPRIDRVEV